VWAGVNIGFDLACAMAWGLLSPDEVFAAYGAGKIVDLSVIERVVEIGGWSKKKDLSLASLHRVYGLGELEKGAVRTSYEPLLGLPLAYYSQEQIDYAVRDAVAGVRVFARQLKRWGQRVHYADCCQLSRQQFWLYLTKTWGLRTDPDRVDDLEAEALAAVEDLVELARGAGFVRADGSRDMKAIQAAVFEAYEGAPPYTEAKRGRKSTKPFVPRIRTDKDTLTASGNPVLEALSDLASWKNVYASASKDRFASLGSEKVYLRAGTVEPIHTKFGLADTTRTTSSRPNVQNVRRSSRKDCENCGHSSPAYVKVCACGAASWRARQGMRECFVPRPGHCFVAIDHSGLELATLAQVCVSLLGRGDMAARINRGEDLHARVAAEILEVDYAEAIERKRAGDKEMKNARSCGKIVNFGRPGGMAAKTLCLYAKQSYGVHFDIPFAERLIELWGRSNPDGVAFLKYVRSLRRGDRFDVVIPGTTIARNQTTYCSAANCHFQGPGAALEAAVGWEIAKAQHVGSGPLRASRLVNFVHDEFIVETPIGTQTEVARALNGIMVGPAAQRYLPDVRISAEFAAMARWSKAAEGRFDAAGNLLIWGLDYA
jgi:hypothetical protein